ncbi:sugar phosphate isomerase/epimerase family protein [Peribacillus sp. SCS-155]|uniref:sugar phosphate isomerase/epimerase family protein n=1 Tax=Peribacillus sedimenti TaxID=3115297 RepID=UPI00390689EF
MKLAYVYGTDDTIAPVLGARGNPDRIFPVLKECGYQAIEPFVRDPNSMNLSAFEKAVNRFGLDVAAIGTGPVVIDDAITFTDRDPDIRRAAVNRVKDIINFSSLFGAPINIGKMRGDIDEKQAHHSWKWMRECLLDVCEYADKCGINIMIEPQNIKNINNLNTALQAIDFIEMIGIPNLYLMVDIFHMSFEDNPISSLTKAKDKLSHIHLADSDRRSPGEGEFDFIPVIDTLKSLHYDAYLSLEVGYEKDRYEEAKRAAGFLTNILNYK